MQEKYKVFSLLASAIPAGPQPHELISLHEIEGEIAKFFGMPRAVAGREVVAALLGEGQWSGLQPSALSIYLRTTTGAAELSRVDGIYVSGDALTPLRTVALEHLRSHLDRGLQIAQVPSGHYGEHAGIHLDLMYSGAMSAFQLVKSDAVQSDPTLTPEQPAEPVGKIGKRWTEAEKNKMRQQRADGWNDGRIAEHWKFKRQNVARLIGSQRANKAKANTPKQ